MNNILVFGGTTEGKKASEILDAIGEHYFYSTKTVTSQYIDGGRVITGAMDSEQIKAFCIDHSIKLMIDAAHPYAVNLHQNIQTSSISLSIPIIRFERPLTSPVNDKYIKLFDSWQDLNDALCASPYKQILFLTGVQTIPYFRNIWTTRECIFRILDTPLSKEKALSFGIPENQVIAMQPNGSAEQLMDLIKNIKADILISKDSGDSGFFDSKVEASRKLGTPLWVVRRPQLNDCDYIVYSSKELLQQLYKLRKNILKSETLRTGYTTGTCVTAAAKASFRALMNQQFQSNESVTLPGGETTDFFIYQAKLSTDSAECTVIKDAGDDPDVIHAAEVGCTVILNNNKGITFERGKGIGVVTLSGLQVAVGEPAINPVPRQMISKALKQMAEDYDYDKGIRVIPFIPEGEAIARKTFNPRIGVEGGLSIIGTSGKVLPYSAEAFISALREQIQVACANGCNEIAATSGKRGEQLLRKQIHHLPDHSFIHYGNMVGEMLNLCANQPISKIHIGMMPAKALKFAEGHLDTHSKLNTFNPSYTASLAQACGYSDEVINTIKELKLAGAIFDIISYSAQEPIYLKIVERCNQQCQAILKNKIECEFIMIIDSDI